MENGIETAYNEKFAQFKHVCELLYWNHLLLFAKYSIALELSYKCHEYHHLEVKSKSKMFLPF